MILDIDERVSEATAALDATSGLRALLLRQLPAIPPRDFTDTDEPDSPPTPEDEGDNGSLSPELLAQIGYGYDENFHSDSSPTSEEGASARVPLGETLRGMQRNSYEKQISMLRTHEITARMRDTRRTKVERETAESETNARIAEADSSAILSAARTLPTLEEMRATQLQLWREGRANQPPLETEERPLAPHPTVLSEEATLVQAIGLEAALNHVQQTESILRGIEQTLHVPEDTYELSSESDSDDNQHLY
jgi:hypothetical protein